MPGSPMGQTTRDNNASLTPRPRNRGSNLARLVFDPIKPKKAKSPRARMARVMARPKAWLWVSTRKNAPVGAVSTSAWTGSTQTRWICGGGSSGGNSVSRSSIHRPRRGVVVRRIGARRHAQAVHRSPEHGAEGDPCAARADECIPDAGHGSRAQHAGTSAVSPMSYRPFGVSYPNGVTNGRRWTDSSSRREAGGTVGRQYRTGSVFSSVAACAFPPVAASGRGNA